MSSLKWLAITAKRRPSACESPRKERGIACQDYMVALRTDACSLALLDRGSVRNQRQRYGESGALPPPFAFRDDLAVMQFDDVTGDGQPEAQAGALGSALALTEPLEDMR